MSRFLSQAALDFVALVLALSSFRYVTDFWLLSLVFSFQTHIALACLIPCLAFIAAGRLRTYASILAFIAAALFIHSLILKTDFGVLTAAPSPTKLRLLEMNIDSLNFDNAERIVSFVESSGADIAVILEAPPILSLFTRLDAIYPHRLGCGNRTTTCDLVMLSKYPFTETEYASLSALRRDRLAIATVNPDGRPLTIIAAHLTKPYYDENHKLELRNLQGVVNRTGNRLVLAGDFNSSVITPDMQAWLASTSLRGGGYETPTWPASLGSFGIGIDHVFTRSPLVINSISRISDHFGSNHFGLMAEIGEAPGR